MKLRTLSISLLATTALVSAVDSANAKTKPGLYEIDGIQEICLQAAGTWYSPTFSGWGGYWEIVTGGKFAKTELHGNYASGAGNDSILVKGKTASWNEWRDSETYMNYLDPVTFSLIGTCSAASWHKPAHANKSNPSQ